MNNNIGFYVPALRGGKAFVPTPPKFIPNVETLITELSECSAILARLDMLIIRLPDPFLLTENLIFMEAVSSSRIEGTIAKFEDLFTTQHNIATTQDILEVKNCADALREGPKLLQSAKSVMDLAKGLHQILMKKHPTMIGGELKKSQNYTVKHDGSIFTYTPPHYLEQAIASFENFTMKTDQRIPELIRQAVFHWIFEQIHPFPDGNGRVGRLLVPLILQYKGVVDTPFALVSEAIETEKREYITHFERLHQTGDWIPWCRFFLSMLHLNADKNITRIQNLEALRLDYKQRVANKAENSILHKITEDLFKKPRFTRRELQLIYGISPRGASLVVQELYERQIIKPVNMLAHRNVIYEAYDILKVLLH